MHNKGSNPCAQVAEGTNGPIQRPNWRQSELDVESAYLEYTPQKSFIDGEEVSYGTPSSSRPDLYQVGSSIEVKNYNVTTSSGRSNLIRNITKQYEQRLIDLPSGTSQKVIIDIRGQNVTDKIIETIYNKLYENTNGGLEIIFKTK